MPSQSQAGGDTRITDWAAASGQTGSPADFAARLHGRQVGAELLEIFRETPEFGRSLAFRIDPFLDEKATGELHLIGGGGEAIVFYQESSQQVIKLLGPPGKAGFGWVVEQDSQGSWRIRAGSLTEALLRFHWFEEVFPSGLELDQIGTEKPFLVLRQPFILGYHPEAGLLHEWMCAQGWTPWSPPSDLAMLRDLTWQRGDFIATDVRPENALVSETDGNLTAIDFIIGRMPPA